MKGKFGLIGLGVMGQNLVLNIESKGFSVSVFNRTPSRTEEFMRRAGNKRKIIPTFDLREFVSSLEKPRKIMLMVKAGKPVDEFLDKLIPLLERGDVIIDGGNSYFRDTERREASLRERKLHFLGCGISGGEYGALHGPSIMAGGDEEGYRKVEEILVKASAQVEGKPCCAYLGRGGGGHFVKMVHNGIEYAIMQTLAEVYSVMREGMGLGYEEMGDIFEEWNKGELNGYLVEITRDIMRKRDPDTGRPVLEVILDRAEQKGTGKWVSQTALDMGVPVPSLAWSVEARIISSFKKLRDRLSREWKIEKGRINRDMMDALRETTYASLILSFVEGMHLIYQAREEFGYHIPLEKVAQIWKGGCIIRSSFLWVLEEVYQKEPNLSHLLLSPRIRKELIPRIQAMKIVSLETRKANFPCPTINSHLDYMLSITSSRLPANLIQAQRDYFGAHTFQRVDQEGYFHLDWIREEKDDL